MLFRVPRLVPRANQFASRSRRKPAQYQYRPNYGLAGGLCVILVYLGEGDYPVLIVDFRDSGLRERQERERGEEAGREIERTGEQFLCNPMAKQNSPF